MNISGNNDTMVECDWNITLQNCSIASYLILKRGPPQLPLGIAIPVTVINVIILVTGLIGNIAVCLVIVKHRNMHTATNYYLFNLAISDLILLVFGLPNDVSVYWHQYPWKLGLPFCKIRALISEMASYASVLTIVAFSTERYISICYPLYIHQISGLRRAVWIIACLWGISFLAALPFSIFTKVNYLYYPPDSDIILEESAFCGMLNQPDMIPLAELSTFLFFILPMAVLVFEYAKMGIQIYDSSRQFMGSIRVSLHRDSRRIQGNRTVVRMLAAVVSAFFISWAPFHFQRLLFIHGKSLNHYYEACEWSFYITGILYYLSSTLNPILYNVMSARYRKAFRSVLCGNNNSGRGTTSTRCSQFDSIKDPQSCASQRGLRINRSVLLDTEDGCSLVPRDGTTCIAQNSFVTLSGVQYKLVNGSNGETSI